MITILLLTEDNRPLEEYTSDLFDGPYTASVIWDDEYPEQWTQEQVDAKYDEVVANFNPGNKPFVINAPDYNSFDYPIWNGTDWDEEDLPTVLARKRDEGIFTIDDEAEQKRLAFITGGAGQAMVYQEKGEEATDFITAGYPADLTGYPFIQAEVTATGLTPTEAADGIVAQKAAWISIGAQIEQIRLAGKKDLMTAFDNNDIDALDVAVIGTVSALEAL